MSSKCLEAFLPKSPRVESGTSLSVIEGAPSIVSLVFGLQVYRWLPGKGRAACQLAGSLP